MIGTGHIEIDARDVSEIAAVLMSLKKEMPAVIVALRGATRIMIQNEISVFIRLSATATAQISKPCDHARGVFEQIHPFSNQSREQIPASRHCRRSAQDWLKARRLRFVENPAHGPRQRLQRPWRQAR